MDALEADLSARVAASLAKYWESAPTNDRRGLVVSPEAAALDARACLTLFCEALRVPDGGWSDLRLTSATMLLAGFGDGFAFESAVDGTRLPDGTLPEVGQTIELALVLGVDAWCSEHGHALPGLARPNAGRMEFDVDASNEHHQSAVASAGLDIRLAPLRAAEDPGWDGYAPATADAAARLDSWMEGYRDTRRRLDGVAPSKLPAGLAAFRAESRPTILRELWHTRRKLHIRLTNGAQAEAIQATALLLPVLRFLYLISTGDTREDVLALPLLTAEEMQAIFEQAGLARWLESARDARTTATDGPAS